MLKRRRFKQASTLQERLIAWANAARDQAGQLPPGLERDDLLQRARQADVAAHMDEWVQSPGLRSPT